VSFFFCYTQLLPVFRTHCFPSCSRLFFVCVVVCLNEHVYVVNKSLKTEQGKSGRENVRILGTVWMSKVGGFESLS